MKTKLKQILVPFLSMIIINFILYSDFFLELGIESPYVGLLFVFGLLFCLEFDLGYCFRMNYLIQIFENLKDFLNKNLTFYY